ncbi:GntR family transcriptional regulator [Pseudogemmobacter sp. W21_MBD1_M6]|jgi:DNA-binding GntR family transcriptional regulator|uniref:GntR family transcriptional regulator n=1 Tax=Pseudogemmobacter sp. W21_MBD1_M6 TaxID=3240271 RepID=UPI003F9B9FAA
MELRRADSIREKLEQMVVVGDFADGERLDEVTLSEKFGVSRTPLREALQMLAASGLVELIPRRGAFVRHPGLVELVEMFEVMAGLEAMCGRLAARRISDADLADLKQTERACQAAVTAGDTDNYYFENERFHHLIYHASGNSFMAAEAERLHKRLQPFRRMQLRVRGRMAQSMDEHKRVVAALEAGNADQVAEALHEHVAIQGEKFNDLMAGYARPGARKAG